MAPTTAPATRVTPLLATCRSERPLKETPRECGARLPLLQTSKSTTGAPMAAAGDLKSEYHQVLLNRRREHRARGDPVPVPLTMEQGSPMKELLYQGNRPVSQKDQDPPSIWANTFHLPDRSYCVDSAVFFKTWSRTRGKRWRTSRRSRLKKIFTPSVRKFLSSKWIKEDVSSCRCISFYPFWWQVFSDGQLDASLFIHFDDKYFWTDN